MVLFNTLVYITKDFAALGKYSLLFVHPTDLLKNRQSQMIHDSIVSLPSYVARLSPRCISLPLNCRTSLRFKPVIMAKSSSENEEQATEYI